MADQPFVGIPILDGHQVTGEHFRERHRRVAQHLRARFGVGLPDHEADCRGTPAGARIYRGYWIVDCPTCRSAEMAWRADPRFLCTSCLNQADGGHCRRVVFPRDADRIEAVLRLRPDPATRNWAAGESLAALARENHDNGLSGP